LGHLGFIKTGFFILDWENPYLLVINTKFVIFYDVTSLQYIKTGEFWKINCTLNKEIMISIEARTDVLIHKVSFKCYFPFSL
jgi:hypothetical protein